MLVTPSSRPCTSSSQSRTHLSFGASRAAAGCWKSGETGGNPDLLKTPSAPDGCRAPRPRPPRKKRWQVSWLVDYRLAATFPVTSPHLADRVPVVLGVWLPHTVAGAAVVTRLRPKRVARHIPFSPSNMRDHLAYTLSQGRPPVNLGSKARGPYKLLEAAETAPLALSNRR
jgi:hypothetical protein